LESVSFSGKLVGTAWEAFMFCNGCGATLQSGQRFCSQCGKVLLGPIEVAQVNKGRVLEHIRILGIVWIAYSAFSLVGAIVLRFISTTIMSVPHGGPEWTFPFIHQALEFITTVVMIKAVLGLITGWGLLQRESWARMAAIILGFLALFLNIPFGTIVGIYTLWVLLPTKSEQEYDAASASVNPVAVK